MNESPDPGSTVPPAVNFITIEYDESSMDTDNSYYYYIFIIHRIWKGCNKKRQNLGHQNDCKEKNTSQDIMPPPTVTNKQTVKTDTSSLTPSGKRLFNHIDTSPLPSNRCSVCNCKESTNSSFIHNKCRRCFSAIQSGLTTTIQYSEHLCRLEQTSIPNLNRTNVRGVLLQPRPNTSSNEPQFGEYYCKPCGRSWKSLRSWSTKYQMCKRCKTPVYPHKLRMLLSSDYKTTREEPKEHERELCQMCKHLGYACKNYGKNVRRT